MTNHLSQYIALFLPIVYFLAVYLKSRSFRSALVSSFGIYFILSLLVPITITLTSILEFGVGMEEYGVLILQIFAMAAVYVAAYKYHFLWLDTMRKSKIYTPEQIAVRVKAGWFMTIGGLLLLFLPWLLAILFFYVVGNPGTESLALMYITTPLGIVLILIGNVFISVYRKKQKDAANSTASGPYLGTS